MSASVNRPSVAVCLAIASAAMVSTMALPAMAETPSNDPSTFHGFFLAFVIALIVAAAWHMWSLRRALHDLISREDKEGRPIAQERVVIFRDAQAGLPEGTIRAILAWFVVSVSVPAIIFQKWLNLPNTGEIGTVLGGVLGFYFGTRTAGAEAEAFRRQADQFRGEAADEVEKRREAQAEATRKTVEAQQAAHEKSGLEQQLAEEKSASEVRENFARSEAAMSTATAQSTLLELHARARDSIAVASAIEGLLPLSPVLASTVHKGLGAADAVLTEGAKALDQVHAAIKAPTTASVTSAVEAVGSALRATGQGTELADRLNDALGTLREVTEAAAMVKAAIDNPSAGAIADALEEANKTLRETGGGGLAPALAGALGPISTVLRTSALGGASVAAPPVSIAFGIALGAWQAWKIGLQHYQRWIARVLDRPVTRDLFPEATWDGAAARKLFAEVPALKRIFGPALDAAPLQVAADLLDLFFLPDAVDRLLAGKLPPDCFPAGKSLPAIGEEGGFLSEAEIEASVNGLRRLVLNQEIDGSTTASVPLGDGRNLSQAEFRTILDYLREAGAGGAIETIGLLSNALIRNPVRDPLTGEESTVPVERLLREALAEAEKRPEAQPQALPSVPPPIEPEA